MDELYAFLDLSSDIATVQVDGCLYQTMFDVPPGTTHGSPTWKNAVAAAISPVLDQCDPNSPNYNPSISPS